MNLFYATEVNDGQIQLPEDEARHCVQVLRRKVGDTIFVVDGRGGFYEGVIEEAGKKKCMARVVNARQDYGRRNYRLHLAIAPTKNMARLEWFLEKATEIGIDEVTPIFCERSERKAIRSGRLEKILLSAMKQSLKAYLPGLHEACSFQAFLQRETGIFHKKFIAHLEEGKKALLKDNYQPGESVCIMIGPEGDFSPEEIEASRRAGFQSVSLGSSRLRTETAGIVACHTINLINE